MSDFTGETGKPFALTHGRLVEPATIVTGQALVIQAGKILGTTPFSELPSDLPQVDVAGRYVTPGLIDLHIHGAAGRTFNEPDLEAWRLITRENGKHGVTALLPTLATAPLDELEHCLALAGRYSAGPEGGAQVLGVHLEGPYFSLAQSGAQNPAHLRVPADGTAETLLAYSGVIAMVTLAPELPGALSLIAQLASLGIVPAADHSAAQNGDVRAAIDCGLRHAIHLWSSQSSVTRTGPWRQPGLLECSLAFDALTTEMIADNRHLPVTLMQLAYKCKGPDRLCVVSDATGGAGLPEGTRFSSFGLECEIRSGVAMLLDQTSFAGSTTLLNQMLRVLTRDVGLPVVEAVRMATLTPARVIGWEQRKGSLQPGRDADVVIFDDDFEPWGTLIGGQWVGGAR